MPFMLVQSSNGSISTQVDPSDVFVEATHISVNASKRCANRNEEGAPIVSGDRVSSKAKAVQLSESTGPFLVGLSESDPRPIDGGQGIIKIVLAFRPAIIAQNICKEV
jgi:hypothetical protein